MLLRIDVYPCNASIDETDEDGIPVSPLPSLYACLKTARADGEVLTVGRKDNDVVLSDKSVSRKHLTVSLVSSHETEVEATKPTTPQEEAACEENHGFALVVTDSSRFGTFLVKEGSHVKAPSKDDNDGTGSDTEDESQQPGAANAGVKLSPIASKLTNSKATLEKFEGRLVLSDFNNRVLIQCGQNGSTLLIRRVPLTLVFSGLEKSTRDLWTNRLPALGATLLPNADDSMTLLVSNKRVSSGKHLAAWYMHKPIVTTEYLQALWDRDSASASMPKEIDCAPTIGSNESFWKKKPKNNLLSGCTYLCLLNDDMRPLIQAAGATVVPLYDLSETDAITQIKDMDMTHAFYISTTTVKVKKIVQHLKRHDVAHVTQKSLGQAVAKFVRLQDHHGNYIGPELEQDKEEEKSGAAQEKEPSCPPPETVPEASKETLEQSVEQVGVDNSMDKKRADDDSQEQHEEQVVEQAATMTACSRKKRSKDGPKETSEDEQDPKQRRKMSADAGEEEMSTRTASSRKKRSKNSTSESAEDEEPQKQRQKSSKDTEDDESAPEASSRKMKRSKQASSKAHLQEEEEPPKQRRKTSAELDPVEEEKSLEVQEEDDDDDDGEPGWNAGDGPKKLRVSNDGWFVAAPSGKKRKAYIREIDLEGEEPPPPPAATAKSSKLVVGPRKAITTSYRVSSMGRSGGKNFKKFRKNIIKKGSLSRIQLRSVLPKESEAEQKLDERERALEEEQRLADALFRDPGAGGIRSHFKPKSRRKRN